MPSKSHENRVAYHRNRRAAFPELNRARNAAYRRANPEKAWAHKQVEVAIKRGSLVSQPCQRCGSEELVHAHHDDYSKPLDVMWLCPAHHKDRHKEIGGPGIVSDPEAVGAKRRQERSCIYESNHRFRVAFDIGGKSFGFGNFDSLEEAIVARDKALPEVAKRREEYKAALARHLVRPVLSTFAQPHVVSDGEIGAEKWTTVGHFLPESFSAC